MKMNGKVEEGAMILMYHCAHDDANGCKQRDKNIDDRTGDGGKIWIVLHTLRGFTQFVIRHRHVILQ